MKSRTRQPQERECRRCGRRLRARSKGSVCPRCVADALVGRESAAEADPSPEIEGFHLEGRLGEGGAGVVWLARPAGGGPGDVVAVKVLKPGLEGEPALRFEAELAALRLMDHPGIARVGASGRTTDGRPFFAMEFVDGEPITTYCARRSLPPAVRLGLFRQVCDAVAHAHEKGIIHRDLKPSNILVSRDGRPVVIDFGVARATERLLVDRTLVTRDGQLMGTPAYMSPEQASLRGEMLDERSDVYSLGVVLFELMTGRTPVDPATLETAPYDEVLREIRTGRVPRPSTRIGGRAGGGSSIEPSALRRFLRAGVDEVAVRALRKRPGDRFASAAELAVAVEAAGSAPAEGSGWWRRRATHGWFAAAAGVAAVAVLVHVSGSGSGFDRDDVARGDGDGAATEAVGAGAATAAAGNPATESEGLAAASARSLRLRPGALSSGGAAILDDPDDHVAWAWFAGDLAERDPAGAATAWEEAFRLASAAGDREAAETARRRIDELLARRVDPAHAAALRISLGANFGSPAPNRGRSWIANEWFDVLHAVTLGPEPALRGSVGTVDLFPWDVARWARAGHFALEEAHARAEAGDRRGAAHRYRWALVPLVAAGAPDAVLRETTTGLARVDPGVADGGDPPDPRALAQAIGAREFASALGLGTEARRWLEVLLLRAFGEPVNDSQVAGLPLAPGWRALFHLERGEYQRALEAAEAETSALEGMKETRHLERLLREIRSGALAGLGRKAGTMDSAP